MKVCFTLPLDQHICDRCSLYFHKDELTLITVIEAQRRWGRIREEIYICKHCLRAPALKGRSDSLDFLGGTVAGTPRAGTHQIEEEK